MKKLFIVANWKSNKTTAEAEEWLERLKIKELGLKNDKKQIIICPPYLSLPLLKSLILNPKFHAQLGAQDVSPFVQGAYTGEVNAMQIKEMADYVIIGHSERRKYFSENEEILTKKVEMCLEYDLTPILCVQSIATPIPKGVSIVAYEPIFAIGTGKADTPEDAQSVSKAIKAKHGIKYVLYGGSVTPENVSSFTTKASVDGVLVGGASLDAEKFIEIIKNA